MTLILILLLALGYIPVTALLMRRSISSPPEPVCGCKHHLSYHDKGTRRCNNYQPGVHEAGKPGVLVQCECRQYVGPEPLPQYFSPEITP